MGEIEVSRKIMEKIAQINEELQKTNDELQRSMHSQQQCIVLSPRGTTHSIFLSKSWRNLLFFSPLFLSRYLDDEAEKRKKENLVDTTNHEAPILGDFNTIAGGFSRGGTSASSRKSYARAVMTLEKVKPDPRLIPYICFTTSDCEDIFPQEDDTIVISIITMGRNVHKVLVDQGSSTDVMFWETYLGLQIPLDQLRPYDGCLVGFTGDQVKVWEYVELRTTFSNENAATTITIKYIVVNTPSAYNLLLGRPSLNRLGEVPSSYHMKVKLPSPEEKVITLRVDQKVVCKCYGSSLRSRRDTYMIDPPRGPRHRNRPHPS